MGQNHVIIVAFSPSAGVVLCVEGVVLLVGALVDTQGEALEHAGTVDDAGDSAAAEPARTSKASAAEAYAIFATRRTRKRGQDRTPPPIVPSRRPYPTCTKG